MRYLVLTIFLLVAGCTSYYNPSLDLSVNRSDRFKKDRQACRDRSKKITNSEPGNDLRFLKTYDAQQKELTNETRAFENCMAGKGWIKK